jgi:hypothetical protein
MVETFAWAVMIGCGALALITFAAWWLGYRGF